MFGIAQSPSAADSNGIQRDFHRASKGCSQRFLMESSFRENIGPGFAVYMSTRPEVMRHPRGCFPPLLENGSGFPQSCFCSSRRGWVMGVLAGSHHLALPLPSLGAAGQRSSRSEEHRTGRAQFTGSSRASELLGERGVEAAAEAHDSDLPVGRSRRGGLGEIKLRATGALRHSAAAYPNCPPVTFDLSCGIEERNSPGFTAPSYTRLGRSSMGTGSVFLANLFPRRCRQ